MILCWLGELERPDRLFFVNSWLSLCASTCFPCFPSLFAFVFQLMFLMNNLFTLDFGRCDKPFPYLPLVVELEVLIDWGLLLLFARQA